MKRILAHKIIHEGREHTLSLLEIADDGMSVTISPFVTETASTVFVDGTVAVIRDPLGRYVAERQSDYLKV